MTYNFYYFFSKSTYVHRRGALLTLPYETLHFKQRKIHTMDNSKSFKKDHLLVKYYKGQTCPDECPMCYTAFCVTQFRVNIRTFDSTLRCDGCGLYVTIWFEERKQVSKRLVPKGRTKSRGMRRSTRIKKRNLMRRILRRSARIQMKKKNQN